VEEAMLTLQAPGRCECGDHAFLAMRRGVTLVDTQDAHLLEDNILWVSDGYAQSKRVGKIHRAILSDAQIVDHKNHDKLDNRRCNLRPATSQENQRNKRSNGRGKSQFKGVSWLAAERRWIVRISINRRKIWVGRFVNEEDAARAYDNAAKQHFGEFAYLNFPEGDVPCHRLS
jgi:hypothetical protein